MSDIPAQTSRIKSYRFKNGLVIVLIVFVTVVLFAQMVVTRPKPEQKPTVISAPLVEVLELEAGPVHFSVDSQGTVQPLTETTLSAEVAGTIVSMSDAFVAGGHFAQGEVLLRIDPVNYQSALERAEATVSQRQIEFDGARKLREQGYRAEAELLSAKAALAAANADLVRARRDLERTEIRVPYNGIVRERVAQLGDYVAPGARLGTVFATDLAEVRLPLPDAELAFVDLPLVNEGAAAAGPAVSLTGHFHGRAARWDARIVRTEAVVDERNRMVFAVARIDDPYRMTGNSETQLPLPVGTFVTAEVDGITIENVVRIPRELVRGGNQIIFVDDELMLRFRTLDFLRTDADYVYVLAEQLEEMRVVTTTLEAPLNGMKVRAGNDLPAMDRAAEPVEAQSDTDEAQATQAAGEV